MRTASGWPKHGPRLGSGYVIPGLALGGGVTLYQQMLNAIGAGAALYDPSDLTSLYQSRTGGSTGAADAVVGIMLDKAQMGNKTAAAFIAGQSELVTNGGFDADVSGWALRAATNGTLSWNAGVLRFARGVGLSTAATQLVSNLTVGRWYYITCLARRVSGTGFASLQLRTGDGGGGSTLVINPDPTASASFVRLTALWYATQTSAHLSLAATVDGDIVEFDDVSMKELPGYHALAPSNAARPILRAGYVDCDGTDDWMQIFPTLNLGEQWWHVGGWDARTLASDYPFALAENAGGVSGVLWSSDGAWKFRNAGDTAHSAITGAASANTPYVVTIEDGTTIIGRLNGVSGSAVSPYDDSGATQGLALFSARNASYSSGFGGRFYGGVWNTGTLSAANRSIIERWVASKAGVSL